MTAIQLGASIILLACAYVLCCVGYSIVTLWKEHGPDDILWERLVLVTLATAVVASFTYGLAFQ